jgi:hypothetical protein
MRTRKNCAWLGCKKQSSKGESYCFKHFIEIDEITSNKPKSPKKPAEVLTALCAAVAAKYKDEGDRVQAGVVISCLSHDPPRFYASVARYPHGLDYQHKVIVCKVDPRDGLFTTAEAAVNALAQKWAAQNRPAPVQQTMEELDEVLRF